MAARVRATESPMKENAMNRLQKVLYNAQRRIPQAGAPGFRATDGASALTARLGSLEELVWLYDQTSRFHFVMGAGTAAPWREVLDALQRRHPLLRVRIERDAIAYPKFVTDEAARIPLRMGDADIGWAGEMSRELQIPFDHRNAPLVRAVVCGDTTG